MFEEWPSRISIDRESADAIKTEILTPLGWQMLLDKLDVDFDAEGSLIAIGTAGRFDYANYYEMCKTNECPSVSRWILGVQLDS